MKKKTPIVYTYEEWEKLPKEEKDKPFSHPRWHQIPAIGKSFESGEVTEEIQKQRKRDKEIIEEFLKKINLPKRQK